MSWLARFPHRRWLAALFLFVLYNANLRPIAAGDSLHNALTPLSIVIDGDLYLDEFADSMRARIPRQDGALQRTAGGEVSRYPVALGVLVAPLYLPLRALPSIAGLPNGDFIRRARLLEKLVASVITVLTVLLFHALLTGLVDARTAAVLSGIFALATPMFSVAAQAMWTHTGGIPLALAALWSVLRALRAAADGSDPSAGRVAALLAAAGVLAGLAFSVRPTNAVVVLALGAGLLALRRYRALGIVAVGAALPVAAQLALNLRWFGRLSGGYETDFGAHFAEGLVGVLVSPARGVLLYVPIVLFALPGTRAWLRRQDVVSRFVVVTSSAAVIGQLLLIAGWNNWWGGHSWGPRLLIEAIPFLLLLAAPAVATALSGGWRRAALWCAAGVGMALQLLGAFGDSDWNSVPRDVEDAPDRVWDWRDNPVARGLSRGVATAPYERVIRALRD